MSCLPFKKTVFFTQAIPYWFLKRFSKACSDYFVNFHVAPTTHMVVFKLNAAVQVALAIHTVDIWVTTNQFDLLNVLAPFLP